MRLRTRLGIYATATVALLGGIFWVGDLIASSSPAVHLNTYSEGCRAGVLSKYSPRGWVVSTGEGEVMMGRNSSVWTVGQGDKAQMRNPWVFSSTDEQFDQYRNLAGKHVVVCYRQLNVQLHRLNGDTDYRVTSMEETNRTRQVSECRASDRSSGPTRSSDGFRTGRIVKASERGRIIDTFEVTIQEGNSGNRFHDLSITDRALYDCAMQYLRADRAAVITYEDSPIRNPLSRDTSLRILAISPSNE